MDSSFDRDEEDEMFPLITEEKSDCEGPSQKSFKSVNLQSGLDSTDDTEEEILRHEVSIKDYSFSPVFPRRKLSGSFRLTPRLEEPRKVPKTVLEEKVDDQMLDLITPHHSLTLNLGVDCPERPLKGRRSIIIPAAERSCRPLFASDFSLSAPENAKTTATSEVEVVGRPCSEPLFPVCKNDQIEKDNIPGDEGNDVLEHSVSCTPEDEPVPKPLCSTPGSRCSRSSCNISSCSSSVSDLQSPNLSEIKKTSQTIESSPGEIEDVEIEEAVADPPELENHENSKDESQGQDDDDVGLPTPYLKPPAAVAASGNVYKVGNTGTLTSSVGSGTSNWTVVSGVSPLPSSDPTHLRHAHFRYGHPYHQHHHHHHHHHHHRRGDGRPHSSMTNIRTHHNLSHDKVVFTSTPIHMKSIKDNVDVSVIQSSKKNEFSLPTIGTTRFVISSELQFSFEFGSSVTGNASPVLGRELVCSQPAIPLVSDNDKENICYKIASASQEPTSSDRKRQHVGNDSTEAEKVPKVQCLTEQGEPSSSLIHTYKNINKDAGHTPYVRCLTKGEAKLLSATPVSMTDDIWEKLPSPRKCSSADEHLSRVIDLGSSSLSRSEDNFEFE